MIPTSVSGRNERIASTVEQVMPSACLHPLLNNLAAIIACSSLDFSRQMTAQFSQVPLVQFAGLGNAARFAGIDP